tara:strand:- start:2408 stop:2767 length:360 start_codon:yes stop_codon:yes gene_type:complete
MANPNLVDVNTITGKTDILAITTSLAAITTNAAASNKVFKINTLIIANVDGTDTCYINASLQRSSTDHYFAFDIEVPADSTLVLIAKDAGIYLEEGDAIRLQATANSDLKGFCSYEILE